MVNPCFVEFCIDVHEPLEDCDVRNSIIVRVLAWTGIVGGSIAFVPSASTATQSRSNSLAGVYHPWRLESVQLFVTVTGTVDRVRREPDHDFHINLHLDPKLSNMINAKNRDHEGGDLVFEVIPMDANRVPVPRVGQHVSHCVIHTECLSR